MNWLKRVGLFILQKGGPEVAKYLPLALKFLPTAGPIGEITAIAHVVMTTEQMFAAAFGADAKKGSEKMKAAVPYVTAIIQQSEIVAGKKILDEAKFIAACTQITEGMVGVLSSVGD